MLAEPRDEYERRAQKRRAEVVALRLQGLTYQEIAERVDSTVGAVGRLLADARRYGEEAAAATGDRRCRHAR
ncbi:sigma factor-like helix-turn-helix DNA-binding protein [Pseudonocardia sp. ICBG1293]|uniref:sigma factor-like helix-turn-helix DNA-binding protein n=1 Tax=Pseudonocardia sp. ICBG1293 TaxID=2844382 RepID=UPI001CCBCC99